MKSVLKSMYGELVVNFEENVVVFSNFKKNDIQVRYLNYKQGCIFKKRDVNSEVICLFLFIIFKKQYSNIVKHWNNVSHFFSHGICMEYAKNEVVCHYLNNYWELKKIIRMKVVALNESNNFPVGCEWFRAGEAKL